MTAKGATGRPFPAPIATGDFIQGLAALPMPKPFRPVQTAAAMAVLVCLGLCLFMAVCGLRANLFGALQNPVVLAKSVLPLILGGLALRLALSSARPEAELRLLALAVPAGVAAILFGVWAAGTAPPDLWPAIRGNTALDCLISVSGLSIGPVVVGVAMLRRGATTRPALSGALIGLAAGGAVAAGYALHCPEDSPLFFVVWYGLGIAIAGAVGALAGHRFLRW